MILAPDFFNYQEARRLLAKFRAKYYDLLSRYVHHTSDSIIQAIFYRDKSDFVASAFEAFNNELVRALWFFQTLFGEFVDESSRKQAVVLFFVQKKWPARLRKQPRGLFDHERD